MTMPHLMNCPHSEDGWCLSCVKEFWEEGKTIELGRQLNVSENGHSVSLGEIVAIEPVSVKRSVCEVTGYYGSDAMRHFQYAPDNEIMTGLKVTCVLRKASDG